MPTGGKKSFSPNHVYPKVLQHWRSNHFTPVYRRPNPTLLLKCWLWVSRSLKYSTSCTCTCAWKDLLLHWSCFKTFSEFWFLCLYTCLKVLVLIPTNSLLAYPTLKTHLTYTNTPKQCCLFMTHASPPNYVFLQILLPKHVMLVVLLYICLFRA